MVHLSGLVTRQLIAIQETPKPKYPQFRLPGKLCTIRPATVNKRKKAKHNQ
jgi:hypothetical protein